MMLQLLQLPISGEIITLPEGAVEKTFAVKMVKSPKDVRPDCPDCKVYLDIGFRNGAGPK